MKKLSLLFLAGCVSLLVSCADTSSVDGVSKAAGDAAVDAATKDLDPISSTLVRQKTGYGTSPVEKAQNDLTDKLKF